MTGACVRRNGQGNSQVDKTPQFTREERQSRILRAVAIIFLIVAAANFVTFVLNWFGPVLPDGPATVVVTGLGAVGSLATAGVALWSMTISQEAARAAEAREEAFRQRAELREATLRQQSENRDDNLRHEAVRPTVNLLVVWRPELYVLANGQSGGALEYSLHNHGTHGIFGILPIVAAPIEYENDAWDNAIWNEIITGPPNPSVLLPGQSLNYRHSDAEMGLGSPRVFDGGALYLLIRYRDSLGWWWAHRIAVTFGGLLGLRIETPQWIDVGEPVHIQPPPWSGRGILAEWKQRGQPFTPPTGYANNPPAS